MPGRSIDFREAADFLHVDDAELERLVQRREVPCAMVNGRQVFYLRELHDWASRRILGANVETLDAYHAQATRMRPAPDRSEAFLSQFLFPECVDLAIRANTRSSLLRKLVALATESKMVCDEAKLLELLNEREELCPTGISGGVAIPHPRIHADYLFMDTFLAVGRVEGGVPFGSVDDAYSDLFFLPCSQDDRTHLYMLTRLARLLQATDLADQLRACVDSEEVVATFHIVETEFVEKADKAK